MANSNNNRKNQKRQNQGGGNRSSKNKGAESQRREEFPEFVINGEEFAHTAKVIPDHMPLYWDPAGFIQLLKPGVYLRYRGGLAELTRKFEFTNAILFALWDDPDASYQVARDRWAQPGANASFLIPNPLDDGPPWLPVQGRVKVDGDQLDTGLLSSWVDQIHCVPFRAKLGQSKEGMTVASVGALGGDYDAADKALLDTLRWLKDNPDDDTTAGVTARLMLVEQGHGLHRAGITLTHRDEATSLEMLDELLPVFAPDVAPVVKAIWEVWHGEELSDHDAVIALAKVLQPHLNDKSPLQEPKNLAVLITWISGIFGSRPDRELNRPSRSLFAVLRYLRQLNGRVDLFGHPDAQPPSFPLNHSQTKDILLDLSRFPDHETDFERLVRAMAVGESTHDFARPNLDHIRPFKIGLPRVSDYPIATKTLLSRYDGIITAWSFRGLEINRNNIDAAHLSSNLILDYTSTAGVRGIARVLGSDRDIVPELTKALTMRPRFGPGIHPHYDALKDLPGQDLAETADQAEKASRAGKAYENRLLDGLSAHEFIVSRNDNQSEDGGYRPVAPEWGDDVEYPVRRQFMFWRAFCRSIQWNAPEVYGEFFEGMLPRLADIPSNLENEALALLRNWIRRDDEHVEKAQAWTGILHERLKSLIDQYIAGETHWDERYSSLFAALAILDRDAFSTELERLSTSSAWDFEDLGRILEAVRHAGWQNELVDEPIYRVLHTRLIDAEGPHADLGRVEWTRKSLERANQSHAIRWFVHRDKFPQVTFSAPFRAWFRESGLRSIEKPDDGVIELLQVALRTIDEQQLDVLLHHLVRSTNWPDKEMLREMLDAGRYIGAAEWLQGHGRATAENVGDVFDGLFEGARTAEDLRRIARLVQFVEEADIRDVSNERERLANALAAHDSTAALPGSAGATVDAWRVAGISPISDAGLKLAESAADWFVTTGDRRFASFIAYTFENVLLGEFRSEIESALSDEEAAKHLGRALFQLKLPPELLPIVDRFEKLSARSAKGKTSYSAMVSATWSRQIRGAVHRMMIERTDSVDGLGAMRTQLPLVLKALESGWHETKEKTNEPAKVSEPAPAAKEVSEKPADADETDATVSQSASDAPSAAKTDAVSTDSDVSVKDSSEPADEAPATDEPHSRFARDVADSAAKGLIASIFETLSFWAKCLADEDAEVPSGAQRLTTYCSTELGVRRELFARLREIARQHELKLNDPRRLLRTDFLDTGTELDSYDFDTLLQLLIGLQSLHDATAELTVNRRSVEVQLTPNAKPVEDEAGNPDDVANETADDSASDVAEDVSDDNIGHESDEQSDEDADALDDDPSDDEADDDSDEAEHSDDGTDLQLGAILRRGWNGDATPEQRRNAFGNSVTPLIARELLSRNEALRLSIQGSGDKPRFILSWRDFR